MKTYSGLRVISGSARGTRLKTPQGPDVRPTLDRVREALFSILGPGLEGAVFLDLFAGSGANGIEALSRGAQTAVFMDSASASVRCIEENLERAKLDGRATVLRGDASTALGRAADRGPYDFVFADPPYALDAYETLVKRVHEAGLLKSGGWLILEHDAKRSLDDHESAELSLLRTARYGSTALTFFEYDPTGT